MVKTKIIVFLAFVNVYLFFCKKCVKNTKLSSQTAKCVVWMKPLLKGMYILIFKKNVDGLLLQSLFYIQLNPDNLGCWHEDPGIYRPEKGHKGTNYLPYKLLLAGPSIAIVLTFTAIPCEQVWTVLHTFIFLSCIFHSYWFVTLKKLGVFKFSHKSNIFVVAKWLQFLKQSCRITLKKMLFVHFLYVKLKEIPGTSLIQSSIETIFFTNPSTENCWENMQ